MVSFAFSSRISIPDNDPAERDERQLPRRERMLEWTAALRENPAFSRFLISQFVFRCGVTMALPLFPLYWVRVVNASDFWIGLINTVNSGVLLVAYFLWSTVSRKRGNVLVLRAAGFGMAFYPLLTGLTGNVQLLVVYAGLAGIFSAGIDLVLFDILLGTCPKQHTASYVALYQVTIFVATFFAPLVGTLVADQAGLSPALFLASGLRFAGVGLFVLLGVGAQNVNPNPWKRKAHG
jgi:MFS-type transporter involved in bile tolerance (Atg22 family)